MVNAELKSYIEKARAKGKKDDEIKKNLLDAGWSQPDINSAFGKNDDLVVPEPPTDSVPTPPKPQSTTSAWDAFEHVLLFISLGVMATSIALILHYFVDKWLPGVPVNNYGYYNSDWQLTLFRGYLAALIVSLPLFSFFFLRITKRAMTNPEIRRENTRKQLIYITLVVTFIIMLWNVITAVYNFLSGNVTANFLLHLVITIGVSGIIFYYYLNEVREDRKFSHA